MPAASAVVRAMRVAAGYKGDPAQELAVTQEHAERERRSHLCFGCSPNNPIGLGLQFQQTGPQQVESQVTLRAELCGWDGVAHGGIVSLLIDEVTSWCLALCGGSERFATREMSVRFLRPTPTGQPLRIIGRIMADKGDHVQLIGEVRHPDGRLTARGRVSIVRLSEERFQAFAQAVAAGGPGAAE